MHVEPDTKIMQTHFGRQTRLKSRQVVRTFTSQTKGIQKLLVHCFDNLPDACQPAAQRFGPALLLTRLMRRGHDLDMLQGFPTLPWSCSSKAFIGHVCSLSRPTHTGQTRRWMLTRGKQGRGQDLIMTTGRSEAKAGNDPAWIDAQQQVEAFIPPNAITPANISLACQPSRASPLGISCHGCCTIKHFIVTLLGLHEVNQVQTEGDNRITMSSHESIELASIRQLWKGGSQVMLRIAVKGSLTRE